jgi:UDP-glucose 4-epimerase
VPGGARGARAGRSAQGGARRAERAVLAVHGVWQLSTGYTPPSVSASEGILVTGGAGFVGATLVRRLVASGYRVRVLDNLTTGDAAHLAGVDAELVKGDIRDAGALDDALEGMRAVIHLAAAGSVIGSVQDPVTNFEVNALGTFRVLDAARRAGIERVVQASTGGALIGDATPPVNEQSLPKPISPYGASKLAGEGYAHAFAKTYGIRTVAIRFGNVYGPWSSRKRGVINAFFSSIHSGAPMVIYGDGSASRDYVHVDDIASALQLALEKDVPGGTVLHAASGVETTVAELADLCRRAAGAPDHPIEYRPKRAGEVGRNFASYELAKEMLGYAPTVTREVGIPRTWKWFQEEVFGD